ALDGAKERLHLFKASLLEEGTFDAAIAGCDCVFHTDPKDNIYIYIYYDHIIWATYWTNCIFMYVFQAELLDPTVNGTLNVLRSCKKASIERVIVTSSMAIVAYNGKPRTPDVVVDETWFSSAEVCETNQPEVPAAEIPHPEENAEENAPDQDNAFFVLNPETAIVVSKIFSEFSKRVLIPQLLTFLVLCVDDFHCDCLKNLLKTFSEFPQPKILH
ncbi:hypothetical protein ZWY2020_033871, partial [Hordeum vulgare]